MCNTCLKESVHRLFETMRVTVSDPVSVKTCTGFCNEDVFPSPKFHNHDTTAPGVVTDLLVNEIVSLAHALSGDAVKLTMGGVPVSTPDGTLTVCVQPLAVATVSDMV